ncbi:ATPase, P-loop-containing, partial [Candidatus Magnetoovum chiemensis]
GGNIIKAIEKEEQLLKALKDEADKIIDTSSFTPHQLRHLIASAYDNLTSTSLKVTLISFGFKYGIPQHLDMLLDVRFLPNPHFVEELRPLTGLDKPVRDYILNKDSAKEYLQKMGDLLNFLIPEYSREGKTYLTIGIGCTGGKHRAPTITEQLLLIIKTHDIPIELIHRDI